MRFPNLALIPLSLLIFGGGAELTARAIWPLDSEEQCSVPDAKTGTASKPNCRAVVHHFESGTIEYVFDSCGQRNLVPCGPAPVAALGASFTEGYMVRVDQAYVNRLGVRVNNFAVGGWGIPQYRARLPDLLAAKPATVILTLTISDLLPAGEQDNALAELRALVDGSRVGVVVQHYLFANPAIYRAVYEMRGEEAYYLARDYSPEWTRRVADAAAFLRDADRQVRDAGARLVVVMIPQRIQAVLRNGELQRHIREAAPELAYVDFFDTLRAHPDPAALYFPFDGHLTAEGHRLLGEQLAAHLR